MCPISGGYVFINPGNVHQYSLDGNISAESFPFLPEIVFMKDCIEEITRFVAAVK